MKGSFPNHHCHTCRLLLFSNHVNFSSMLFSPGLAGSSEQSEVELNCSVCCLYPWDSRFIPLGSVSYRHSSTSLDFLTIHLALFVLLCKSLDPYEKHSRLQKEKVRFFLTKRSEYSYQEAFEPGAQVWPVIQTPGPAGAPGRWLCTNGWLWSLQKVTDLSYLRHIVWEWNAWQGFLWAN